MTYRAYLAAFAIMTLAPGCDAESSDSGDSAGMTTKADSAGSSGGDSDCAEGFEPIGGSSECLADAGCYELPDGTWCTGGCPAGQGLDESVPPQCVDVPFPGCLEGFELVDTESDCLQDASCYAEDPYGWCTGECPDGGELTLTEAGPTCIGGGGGSACADGFDPIASDQECLADAACYELPDGSWCTGACPAGQELDTSVPPMCVDAAFGGCLPGFELVETESGCIADALCYPEAPYGWCTGECPQGTTFMQTETGPACV